MAPQIFNFSAGPAMLPAPILQQVQQALSNWQGLGSSVMEFSHRSDAFMQVILEAEQDLRDLLNIPVGYKVLYCQGGARGQFAAVPLNLLAKPAQADYIISGYWSRSARQEAEKYCAPNAIDVTCLQDGMRSIQPMHEWPLSKQSAFIHYCPNETIDGIAIDELPDFGDRIVVADMSSTLLSRPLEVSRFGIIYACAQKNIGPAGITLVIIREDLLDRARPTVPSILNYSLLAQNHSMFNTPPTFAWYCCSLIFKWLKSQGGLSAIAEHNQKKAAALYHFIDAHSFYNNNIDDKNRSLMNVPFQLADSKLESLFLQEATATGLLALKGHKAVGGLRASIYNAMPFQGVKALIQFMHTFYQRYVIPAKN